MWVALMPRKIVHERSAVAQSVAPSVPQLTLESAPSADTGVLAQTQEDENNADNMDTMARRSEVIELDPEDEKMVSDCKPIWRSIWYVLKMA